MNMEKKLIKVLEVLSDYVKEHNNCTLFEIDFDGSGNLYYSNGTVYCLNGVEGNVTTPIPFGRHLELFFDNLLGNEVGTDSPNDSEYYSYEMIIDAVSRKITINGIYDENIVYDTYDEKIDLKGEKKELFWNALDSIIGDNRRTFDVEIIGGGDGGYLECALHTLPNDVEETLYRILEDKAPGWEINNGSGGRFIIDPIKKTIQFNLDVYEEEQRSEEEYMYIY